MDETDVPMNVTVLLHLQLLHEKNTYQDLTSEASALFSVSANVVHHNAPIKIYTAHQNLCFCRDLHSYAWWCNIETSFWHDFRFKDCTKLTSVLTSVHTGTLSVSPKQGSTQHIHSALLGRKKGFRFFPSLRFCKSLCLMYSPFWSCTSQSSELSHSVDSGNLHSSLSSNSNAWFLPPSGSAHQLLSNLSLQTWDLDQATPGSHSTSSAHMVPVWRQQHMACWFRVLLFISSQILRSCSLK